MVKKNFGLHVLLCSLLSLNCFAGDLITSVAIKKNTLKVKANEKFKAKYLKSDFFVEYEDDIDLEKLPYEVVVSSFITNIIAIVWISGEDYYIDSMDEDLFHSLATLKQIFKIAYPSYSFGGNLIPRKLVPLANEWKYEGTKKALLFSGGLDSTSTALMHKDEDLHFITAWGQFDTPLKLRDTWEKRKNNIETFAKSLDRPVSCSFLKSNYSAFFKKKLLDPLSPRKSWRVSFIEDIGWVGLVAPIMLTKKCSMLYVASSYAWTYPYFAAANPFVDGCMKCAQFTLQHDQFDMSRPDKNRLVSEVVKRDGIEKPFIKVCLNTKNDTNCGNCSKCLLTIIGFALAGDDHRDYGFSVSLDEAVKRLMKLSHVRVGYSTVWNLGYVKEMIRMAKHISPTVAQQLEPLLSLRLRRVKRMKQSRVQWEDFAKLVPDVEIPSYLSAKTG